MDDVEAMLTTNREQLHFRADEHGGEVAGELIVIDRDRRTKKPIEIDCTAFGSGAYSVPTVVEELQFKTKAKFVLCVETKGMFERLVEEDFYHNQHCILVSMGGACPAGPAGGSSAALPTAISCPSTSSPTATRTAISTSTAR